MTNDTLPTYKRNDPLWYYSTPEATPVPALFIKDSRAKHGITIELAGSRQKQCSYAHVTRREVVQQ